jgi:acyl-CoA reductase-like NAD-dependent aldehyde dehydrogenase
MDWHRSELFVDGGFVPAHSTRSLPLISPASEEEIGSIRDCGASDLDRAVASAQSALPAWRETSVAERGRLLAVLADLFEDHVEEITSLVSQQNGSVITRSRSSNGILPLATYRAHAALAAGFEAERLVETPSGRSLVRREPIGVVGAIVPWNAPQILLAGKLAPALLAGCTVVAKPSPETSLDALLLAELAIEAGLPPGVLNIVTGGRETGMALVEHPGTDKIAFTGSTLAGRIIARTCGELLKPVTAELGGKSAAVVLDDADLAQFSAALISTCLPNTGQVCYSCTRVLAPRSRFDEVLDAVVTRLEAARLGEPADPASEFGPLVTARQRERVESYIASGLAEGARLVLGGGRPKEFPVGYYVEPTVFVDVTSSMRIFREEIFGPVLVVMAYDDDDDAVRIANDSTYGLGGSVFSADVTRATELARRVATGKIAVNAAPGAPGIVTDGYKDSGFGGLDSIEAYLQTKAIPLPG